MLTETLNSQHSSPNQGLGRLLPWLLPSFPEDLTLQVERGDDSSSICGLGDLGAKEPTCE